MDVSMWANPEHFLLDCRIEWLADITWHKMAFRGGPGNPVMGEISHSMTHFAYSQVFITVRVQHFLLCSVNFVVTL